MAGFGAGRFGFDARVLEVEDVLEGAMVVLCSGERLVVWKLRTSKAETCESAARRAHDG